MTSMAVGRIVDLGCHEQPPIPICGRCVELERAIRKHKETKDMSKSFLTDALADTELWKVLEKADK